MVGEVTGVDTHILSVLVESNFIPVIAPVGAGKEGESYNINADTVAGQIARSLKARKLIMLTDTLGVLDGNGNLISTLTREESLQMIQEGTIRGGMIPKVTCCLDALEGGVRKAHVIDGRQEHALLLEIFTKGGVGTEIIG